MSTFLAGKPARDDGMYVKSEFDKDKDKDTTTFRQSRNDFHNKTRARMTVREALEKLDTFVDECDPDTQESQAEALRKDGKPRWMQLVGLIHDLGKLVFLYERQRSMGCCRRYFPVHQTGVPTVSKADIWRGKLKTGRTRTCHNSNQLDQLTPVQQPSSDPLKFLLHRSITIMGSTKLRIGIAGLGRMGKRHAVNFHHLTERANVVAVSTPDAAEREWGRCNLEGVTVYADYDEMLEKEDLQAVVVASVTSVHAEQALKAITKGYHVLCEKPLSINLEVAREVLEGYQKALSGKPDQKVMCAFSRRFDASYREAHELISSGSHGAPVVFRSQTADLHDTTGSFVNYAKTSGGIFVDCSIHDIDLMLWFLGETRKLKSVQSVGVTAVHPELNEMKDRDNAIATVEFDGGKIAQLYCTRMMAAGQEDTTEIICERGSFRINMEGRKNHVEIHDTYGARRELPKHYYERFREAFITEASEFTACCLDNKALPVSLESSVRAIVIADALQRSLVTGKKIVFGKDGIEETEPATL